MECYTYFKYYKIRDREYYIKYSPLDKEIGREVGDPTCNSYWEHVKTINNYREDVCFAPKKKKKKGRPLLPGFLRQLYHNGLCA